MPFDRERQSSLIQSQDRVPRTPITFLVSAGIVLPIATHRGTEPHADMTQGKGEPL
jgi:hypothetical protein